jgi:putative ABC transport system ATP-binding protein
MIRTHQLGFRHPAGPELSFADVAVAQGGLLLLRGASGSGKSTWLALAAGLLTASSGQITVANQSMQTLGRLASDAWRAKNIGFLPQKLHLSAALTVYENLAMAQWAADQPQDDDTLRHALAALDVVHLAQRKPAQLSGGQAQRIALARAVLLLPKVLLADEPTASLDDDAAAAALTLLRQTAERTGATLVIATHDNRVAVFFSGHGNLQTLFCSPQAS